MYFNISCIAKINIGLDSVYCKNSNGSYFGIQNLYLMRKHICFILKGLVGNLNPCSPCYAKKCRFYSHWSLVMDIKTI
jgi:hypothetical protein